MSETLFSQTEIFASNLDINIACQRNAVRIINVKLKDYIDVFIEIFKRVSLTFSFNYESIVDEY